MSNGLPLFIEFARQVQQYFPPEIQDTSPPTENNPAAWLDTVKTFVPLITAVTAILGLTLSATLFKWNESWHNAEQISRALYAMLLNYARHGIANMERLTREYGESKKKSYLYRIPSEEMLLRQKYELANLTDTSKERLQLLGPSTIYRLERLFLVIRNLNIEVDAAIKRLDKGKMLDYETRKCDIESIFKRNLRIVMLSHEGAHELRALLAKNRKFPYYVRFRYITINRGTIFTEFERRRELFSLGTILDDVPFFGGHNILVDFVFFIPYVLIYVLVVVPTLIVLHVVVSCYRAICNCCGLDYVKSFRRMASDENITDPIKLVDIVDIDLEFLDKPKKERIIEVIKSYIHSEDEARYEDYIKRISEMIDRVYAEQSGNPTLSPSDANSIASG